MTNNSPLYELKQAKPVATSAKTPPGAKHPQPYKPAERQKPAKTQQQPPSTRPNYEHAFFERLLHKKVKLIFVDGSETTATLDWFDKFSVGLGANGNSVAVWKHAIRSLEATHSEKGHADAE